ncbi:hypothetical protein [Streptomyces diacarni]|uniref:hypothetical protein n=1 Tax=Streptomyces diacarni TaxID=2800381 RepID=UPI000DE8B7E7|nr:hypothetical protein [Streptomyces diacarni]
MRSKRSAALGAVLFSTLVLGAGPVANAAGVESDHAAPQTAQTKGMAGKPKPCAKGAACWLSENGTVILSTTGNWSAPDERIVWAAGVTNRGTAGKYDHIKVKIRATGGPVQTVCLSRGKKHSFGSYVAAISIKWAQSC